MHKPPKLRPSHQQLYMIAISLQSVFRTGSHREVRKRIEHRRAQHMWCLTLRLNRTRPIRVYSMCSSPPPFPDLQRVMAWNGGDCESAGCFLYLYETRWVPMRCAWTREIYTRRDARCFASLCFECSSSAWARDRSRAAGARRRLDDSRSLGWADRCGPLSSGLSMWWGRCPNSRAVQWSGRPRNCRPRPVLCAGRSFASPSPADCPSCFSPPHHLLHRFLLTLIFIVDCDSTSTGFRIDAPVTRIGWRSIRMSVARG